MSKCFYCGEELGNLPFKCKYCEELHCGPHRLPENHACTGPLKSPPKMKPVKHITFQDISTKYENYESYSSSKSYSSPQRKTNSLKYLACVIVVLSILVLGYIYGIDSVQMDFQLVSLFENIIGTIFIFGLIIMLPLMFAKPKNRSKLSLMRSIKKEITKIVILVEVMVIFIGFGTAGTYAVQRMGNFGTIFWTVIGLSNLFLLGIYLEIKSRVNESNQLELTMKRVTHLSSILISVNFFFLILLGVLTYGSIIPYSTLDYFLEYYWISYSLFIGFHLGRIVTRW